VHCISKHALVPTAAKNEKPYACDGTDLVPATEEQIRSHGGGSHRPNKRLADASRDKDDSESRDASGAGSTHEDEVLKIAATTVLTKAQLKSRPEASEGTPSDVNLESCLLTS